MDGQQRYAVAFTAPEQAELIAVDPDPEPPGPREVEGPTLVTLISAGTELAGGYQGTRFPSRPGYAAAFRVQSVGAEVTDVRPGDLAFCMGRHQSHQRVARERMVPVPDGVSPEEATFARLMGVSMTTLMTTRARPTEKVVVTGLGLVGHLAARIFAASGYEVTGVDPSEQRREIARKAGLTRVVATAPVDNPEYARQVALVIDCSGHEEAVLAGCRLVRKRGEVVLIGAPWRRRSDVTAHEILYEVFHHYVDLRSGWEWELPLDVADFRPHGIFANFAAALRWIADGRVAVAGLCAPTAPAQAQRAFQDLLRGRCERLGYYFDWT